MVLYRSCAQPTCAWMANAQFGTSNATRIHAAHMWLHPCIQCTEINIIFLLAFGLQGWRLLSGPIGAAAHGPVGKDETGRIGISGAIRSTVPCRFFPPSLPFRRCYFGSGWLRRLPGLCSQMYLRRGALTRPANWLLGLLVGLVDQSAWMENEPTGPLKLAEASSPKVLRYRYRYRYRCEPSCRRLCGPHPSLIQRRPQSRSLLTDLLV